MALRKKYREQHLGLYAAHGFALPHVYLSRAAILACALLPTRFVKRMLPYRMLQLVKTRQDGHLQETAAGGCRAEPQPLALADHLQLRRYQLVVHVVVATFGGQLQREGAVDAARTSVADPSGYVCCVLLCRNDSVNTQIKRRAHTRRRITVVPLRQSDRC